MDAARYFERYAILQQFVGASVDLRKLPGGSNSRPYTGQASKQPMKLAVL